MASLFSFKKKSEKAVREIRIPEHIAFIMDGNGRWAKKRSMPREYGHSKGADVFRDIIRYCGELGVKHITVYAFSTENWKRPEAEVNAIMKLLSKFMDEAFADLAKEKVRVIFLGSKEPFSAELRERMEKLEHDSAIYERILNVAFNYGGRDEIVHACNELIAEGVTAVTTELIGEHLYTRLSPDPDLIVRTAGEYRISNFLMWQSAYSEFYFTDKLWPDMTHADVDAAIAAYSGRERRYGGVIDKKEDTKV
ncbi:MAG: di-trans,poly-cis-decaprenylcistransferase [Clostridia bacterium]|nr:di-trans,poly-cis-decaprenylcistransferase [Clostridia bacterium]